MATDSYTTSWDVTGGRNKMNLRQLEVFRAIMRARTVSGAARLLNVSQPSVSNVLKHTETTLGLTLFERRGTKLVATPEAERLIPEVEKMFTAVEACLKLAKSLREDGDKIISIASSPTLTQAVLLGALAEFRLKNPSIDINLITCTTDEVLASVLRRQVDFGVAYVLPGREGADAKWVGRTSVCAIIPPDDSMCDKETIHLGDLIGKTVISYRGETPLGVLLKQQMSEQNVSLPIEVRANCLAAYTLSANGVGIALVDRLITMCRFYDSLVVRPLEPAISIDIQVLTAPGTTRSRAQRELIETISKAFQQSPPLLPNSQ